MIVRIDKDQIACVICASSWRCIVSQSVSITSSLWKRQFYDAAGPVTSLSRVNVPCFFTVTRLRLFLSLSIFRQMLKRQIAVMGICFLTLSRALQLDPPLFGEFSSLEIVVLSRLSPQPPFGTVLTAGSVLSLASVFVCLSHVSVLSCVFFSSVCHPIYTSTLL
jgi:hypothetical protein